MPKKDRIRPERAEKQTERAEKRAERAEKRAERVKKDQNSPKRPKNRPQRSLFVCRHPEGTRMALQKMLGDDWKVIGYQHSIGGESFKAIVCQRPMKPRDALWVEEVLSLRGRPGIEILYI
jgi:ABC-type hemin transport system substrate-binding protein